MSSIVLSAGFPLESDTSEIGMLVENFCNSGSVFCAVYIINSSLSLPCLHLVHRLFLQRNQFIGQGGHLVDHRLLLLGDPDLLHGFCNKKQQVLRGGEIAMKKSMNQSTLTMILNGGSIFALVLKKPQNTFTARPKKSKEADYCNGTDDII